MKICVVVTGMNDEGTIIESIESVLSQGHYPDQIGFAHGPSRDQSEDFAGFYREEFDFVHWDSRLDASASGLMHLRLGTLKEIETSHVLFLRADSYLYRDALERLVGLSGDPDLVMAPVRFMPPDGDDWNWLPPDSTTPSDLLDAGPVPPSAVLWRTERLRDVYSDLQPMKLGPFTTLGWLRRLGEAGAELSLLEAPLVETWDFREGEHCWTTRVFNQIDRTLEVLGHEDDGDWSRSMLMNRPTPPGWFEEESSRTEDGTSPDRSCDWIDESYPMVE